MGFLKRQRFVSVIGRKSTVPEGTWIKCSKCNQAVYRAELEANQYVCALCGFHFRVTAWQRISWLVDRDSFEERYAGVQSADPLGFTVDEVKYSYKDRVKRAQESSGIAEAAITGRASIEGTPAMLGVMDFTFRGGSMGSALGEKFYRAATDAVAENIPFVMFASSGGARMEEGILSLMQMAKTSDAVRQMNEAGVPYISVLTDPTTGGVYASFAALGDVVLAEPNAHIGFAGPRLIESALKVSLPDGFQKAEYQFQHGFVDKIVKRTEMRSALGKILHYLSPSDRDRADQHGQDIASPEDSETESSEPSSREPS